MSRFQKMKRIAVRIVICIFLLFIGVAGMAFFTKLKKPPPERVSREPALQVEVLEVKTEDVPTLITGYGEVRSLNVVSMAPEVSGKIVMVHPRLEQGEVIPKDEILFRIDPRDYAASLDEAVSSVRQMEDSIMRLRKQYEIDQKRLKTMQRNQELAKEQYDRVRLLFEEDSVGSLTGVNQAEQSYNSALDQVEQMTRTVELYPIQIRESESGLASARARRETAQIRLDRCIVRSPFDGRVKDVTLEKGQYVTPGMNVITLADDSMLEIHVPLDSREAAKWLRYDGEQDPGMNSWFMKLENVKCRIQWTEADDDAYFTGILHRIVKFDNHTRTVTAAVRVREEDVILSGGNRLPLVEGMFCSVEIPGRSMRNVIRLPRWSVNSEGSVYMAVNGRLKTVPLEIAREVNEDIFVSSGLKQGDIVIITRLVNPLENSLIEISGDKEGKS